MLGKYKGIAINKSEYRRRSGVVNSSKSRRAWSCVRASYVLIAAMVAFLSVPAFAQNNGPVELETVSPQMYTINRPDGTAVTVPDEAASGQILVQMTRMATRDDLARVLAQTNTEVLHSYRTPGLFLLQLPEGQSVVDAQRELSGMQGVQYAAPDRVKHLFRTPNDTDYTQQWHYPVIAAPDAWDIQTGSSSTVVAVIDDGIQLDHPDLSGKIWVNTGEIPDNGIDDDGNGYVDDVNGWDFIQRNNDPSPNPVDGADDVHHGTHVAGLIGAMTNNMEGVAGMDWGCRLMACRVFHTGMETLDSHVMAAIEYAVDNGADIINMSLGGGYNPAYNPIFANAVEQGVLPVASAGNFGYAFTDNPDEPNRPWLSPVCNDGEDFVDNNVLGVGATGRNDIVADFSNLDASARNFVDVMAPGVEIYSTLYYDPEYPGGTYGRPYGWHTENGEVMSGTSMSCPIVAGLAAIIRAEFSQFSPEGLITQIRAAAENIDEENPQYAGQMGEGRINAVNSLVDQEPRLPRTFSAFDKPNDDGGYIQVVWQHSPDDGAGFDDVTGYMLQRATDAEGPWTTLETYEPGGETQYVDAVGEDAPPYYYRLGVSDASQTVYTAPVGPVEARDDTPPPALAEGELVAGDVQGDDGGAIQLNWDAYTPPDDFFAYRVWRAKEPFDDVTNFPEPLDRILDDEQKSYTDHNDVQDGVEYYYAVTVQDEETPPNEIMQVNAVGPVVASPNFTFRYPAGLSMIAIGATPHNSNMGAIFGVENPGDLQLARWDPTAQPDGTYVVYSQSPQSPFLQQRLGRGFWYRTPVQKPLNISGMPAPEGRVSVNVRKGWNQLGNPYTADMPLEGAQVEVLGTMMSLEQSDDNGYTRDYVWRYDTFTNSYKLVSATLPFLPESQRSIPRGEGFYFRSLTDQVTLYLPRPTVEQASSQRAPAPKPQVDENNWALRLQAAMADQADVDNFIGVSPQAETCSNVASPPHIDGGVDLSFVDDSGNKSATEFVQSVKAGHTWTATVSADKPGASVRLSWPDLTQVPSDLRLTLEDASTGQTQNMRTTTGYEYTVTEDATPRRFKITVSDKTANALTVNSLQAVETRAGAQISFTLSESAEVDVEIFNIAGRRVCSVASGSLATAGTNTYVWNGRGNTAPAPPGRYLVSVVARADDGTLVKAVRSLQLRR
ncbi:MAG: S8 family serine peptidase [Armatimonadota bacterium]